MTFVRCDEKRFLSRASSAVRICTDCICITAISWGVLPEKTTYRPTSPILREDIHKMDEISDQARYMSRNGISTMEDLLGDRENITAEINELTA